MSKFSFHETGTAQSALVAQAAREIANECLWLVGYSDQKSATIHFLKTQDPHFGDIRSGLKLYEIRLDDRGGYQCGDWLVLEQYDLSKGAYTGQVEMGFVTHILLSAQFLQGLNPGYVVISFIRVDSSSAQPKEVSA